MTHDADKDAGATKDILANFPEATDIKVTTTENNPNYMSWVTKAGEFCTAYASGTQLASDTPGQIIGTPYCRQES